MKTDFDTFYKMVGKR